MTILVTGGAGFIGTNFIFNAFSKLDDKIINLDKLTYASNLDNFSSLVDSSRYKFVQGDIRDTALVLQLLKDSKPRAIINFAAESHVDRSILNPADFIQTNIVGTFKLLECAKKYWQNLSSEAHSNFRFIHISTDEVYGSLSEEEPPFNEANRYQPNSPYSASKAASDHLVRAYFYTYNLPVITTNCSNNYGPYQFPEKLIPKTIINALTGKDLPIYGDGKQIRDWLFVTDHCNAILRVLEKGRTGEVYNIGGCSERTNLEIVSQICEVLDKYKPKKNNTSYANQIKFIKDRRGHDRRYAIDSSKIKQELGWIPETNLFKGLDLTIKWYLDRYCN